MSEASEKIQKRAEELVELFGTATVVTVGGLKLCDFGDLQTLLAERTWRPISEAPTDGTRVLVWWPALRVKEPVTAIYGERWIATGVPHSRDLAPPTHFMVLPPPPEPV